MPVTSYSTTPGNNNAAPPNGAPEGMAPADVNNCIRQIMADMAVEAQVNAVKVLASVSGADTITGSMTPDLTALSNGMTVIFKPAAANTGAATLNIDGLGAKNIVKAGAAALVANDLVTTQPAYCIYDSANTRFLLLNPQTAPDTAATILAALLTVDGAGSGLDADTLDGISSSGFLQVQVASKASDTSRSNTTTLADDPDLVISSLAVGTYKVELFVNCAVSGGTPGFNCGFATSATVAASYSQSDTCVATVITPTSRALISSVSLGGGVTTSPTVNYIHWIGTLVITAPGNLRFQWAQAGLDAVNSSIAKAGSWLIVSKVT